MPYGQESTTRVELSEDGYWCEVKSRIKVADAQAFVGLKEVFGLESATALANVVANWNVDDAEGNVLPISGETVHKSLWIEDFRAIQDAVNTIGQPRKGKDAKDFMKPSKATSSATDQPPVAA